MKFFPELEDEWKKTFNNLAKANVENHRASHWTKEGFDIRFAHISPLLRKMCSSVDGPVLDMGAGPGEYSVCGNNIVSADYSENALKRIFGPAANKRICCDISKLPFESESFDGFFTIGMLQCLRLNSAIVEEIKRVVKKGSWLLFETLNLHYSEFNEYFLNRNVSSSVYEIVSNFVIYDSTNLANFIKAFGFEVSPPVFLYPDGKMSIGEKIRKKMGVNSFAMEKCSRSFYFMARKL
jgi:SAM-dependent methyltransferase